MSRLNQQLREDWRPAFESGEAMLSQRLAFTVGEVTNRAKLKWVNSPSLGNVKSAPPSPKALGCSVMIPSTAPLLPHSVHEDSRAPTREIWSLSFTLFQAQCLCKDAVKTAVVSQISWEQNCFVSFRECLKRSLK